MRSFSTMMKPKIVKSKPVVAIAGSTGAVGQEFIKLLEERKFPFSDLKLLASGRSAGKKEKIMGKEYTVQELKADSFDGVDIAFFSAGGSRSRDFAPAAAKSGAVVIDNSSYYRMDPDVPLVVPEVNGKEALGYLKKGIIANPNCSTIIMNMAVWPIHQKVGVERVVVSTYQAASGAGAAAMDELEQQAKDWVAGRPLTKKVFGRQYIFNIFSHNSSMDVASGYNEEEIKMLKETRKIFNDPNIHVSATCVRVPVLRAHCESVNLTLKKPMTPEEARELLSKAPGVTIVDDRVKNLHPEPINASGKDNCLVGRIRVDTSVPGKNMGLALFVAGDQIRKGAALNGIQIAEMLINSKKA